MADPATLADLTAAQISNGSAYDGGAVIACPFCGAANFMTLPLASNRDALAAGATCSECGRSGRYAFAGGIVAPGIAYTFVQTGGADPLPFMDPMPARE